MGGCARVFESAFGGRDLEIIMLANRVLRGCAHMRMCVLELMFMQILTVISFFIVCGEVIRDVAGADGGSGVGCM